MAGLIMSMALDSYEIKEMISILLAASSNANVARLFASHSRIPFQARAAELCADFCVSALLIRDPAFS